MPFFYDNVSDVLQVRGAREGLYCLQGISSYCGYEGDLCRRFVSGGAWTLHIRLSPDAPIRVYGLVCIYQLCIYVRIYGWTRC